MNEILFDQDKMFGDNEEYKGILKPGENKDQQGNANMYMKHKDYGMTLLFNMGDESCDDEILQMFLDAVPHIAKMKKVFITEWDPK